MLGFSLNSIKVFACVLVLSCQAFAVVLKVVGGRNAQQGRWPSMALILTTQESSRGLLMCGGTRIHPEWVLTSAVCLRKYQSIAVVFGVWNITNDLEPGRKHYDAAQVIVHPCFDASHPALSTDLALIKIATGDAGQNQQRQQEACLPRLPHQDWNNLEAGVSIKDCIALGYGLTANGREAQVLQRADFSETSQAICERAYGGAISKKKICSKGVVGKDTCNGDQGGPLFCPTRNATCGNMYLAGVISAGSSSCAIGRSTVYTATFPAVGWIQEIINSLPDGRSKTKRTSISCDSQTLSIKHSGENPIKSPPVLPRPYIRPPSVLLLPTPSQSPTSSQPSSTSDEVATNVTAAAQDDPSTLPA